MTTLSVSRSRLDVVPNPLDWNDLAAFKALGAGQTVDVRAYHEHGSSRNLTGGTLEVFFTGSLLA